MRPIVGRECCAWSTSATTVSKKPAPGAAVTLMTSQSEITSVPPTTAERSSLLSRMTGANSPVIGNSSTEATPATTVPSVGMVSFASTRTKSPRHQQVARHQFVATAIAHTGSGKTFRYGLLPGCAQGIQPCRAASSAESLPEHGQEYQRPQPRSSDSSKGRIRSRCRGETNDSEQRRRNRQQLERK